MKTTLKVLAPFGTAVITVIVFYLLGVVFLLLGFIFNLFDLDAIVDIFDNTYVPLKSKTNYLQY